MTTNNELFSRERLAGYDPACLTSGIALVVGAGALGQNTAQNLALAGIGELRIVDKDSFEDHNRTRSPIYPLPEEKELLGLSKARAVACKLRRIMTAPRPVMRYAHRWIQELGDGAFKDVSVVIACVDNPEARAYLSDKARLHCIPYIEGGFEGPEISLSCYPVAKGEKAQAAPCWQCSHQDLLGAFSCKFYATLAEESGVVPAIQNAAATLAGLQSEAAVLALHGDTIMPFEFVAFDLNVRTMQVRKIRLAADPQCEGLHRSLDEEPLKLRTSADVTVENLLQEISDYFGKPSVIELFTPLIWTAPCTVCGRITSVQSLNWLWMKTPRCEQCDGPYPLVGSDEYIKSAMVFNQLSFQSDPKVLRAACREAGLPPLSLIEARDEGGLSRFFELAGTVDDLFELGDTYEQ